MASENSPTARAAITRTAPTNVKNIGARTGLARSEATTTSQRTQPAPPAPPAAPDKNVSSYLADAAPIEVAQPDVTEETLKKSAEYMARERALQSALDLFGANQATDLARYSEGYNKNLTNLGWRSDINDWDYGQLLSSGERATESGKGFNNLANDYAARGMLQSGAYQAARSILSNQLNEQRGAIEKSKATFGEDQQKARAQLLAQQEQERTQALADARAAILGGMGV